MKKFKIVSCLDEGGTREIRLRLPLSKIDGQVITMNGEQRGIEVEFKNFKQNESILLTEEMLKGVDLLYGTWLYSNDAVELSLLKDKLGFKLIVDVDDSWNDPIHPFYIPEWSYAVPRLAVLADFITTTNPFLAERLKYWNENVAIIPNFLPVGEGQYIGKPEEKKYNGENKLRISIYGSSSHVNDYKLMKPIINRLAANKEIAEKCEFNLLGFYPETPISKEFLKKKNLRINIFPPKSVDNYMELLDNTDVVLMPLEDSDYNRAKSGLKVLETSIKEGVLIGSPLYKTKEFPSYFSAEKAIDYETIILHLLESGNYEKWRSQFVEENLKRNKWEERVDFTKKLVEIVANGEKRGLEDVELYSIVYSDDQVAEYEKYDNSVIRTVEQKSYLFEANPTINIIDNLEKKEGYLGIFSYKLSLKNNVYRDLLFKLLKEADYKQYDVINLTPYYRDLDGKFLAWSELKHPTFNDKFERLCNKIGLEYKEPVNTIFSGMFIAKKELYIEFVNTILKKAIDILETDMREEAFENSKYISNLSEEKLEELTGLNYWTFHTFLLERLFGVWVDSKKDLKILNLLHK